MIIDSHAYSFQQPGLAEGYESEHEHLSWIQQVQARHHQPAIRLSDRTLGSANYLAPLGNSLSDLPDANFRIDHEIGRVLWDWNGETYTKYYYPPNLRNLEFTSSSLISEMDYAGIDLALLHTNPSLGKSNQYQYDCIKKFPGRLLSMASVDEWLIVNNPDKIINSTVHAIENLHLSAIKFNPTVYIGDNKPWDDGKYRPFWEIVTKLGVPIFFTLGTGPEFTSQSDQNRSASDGFFTELRILLRWMERYPNTKCSITHGFPWRVFRNGNKVELPDSIWNPFKNPNLHMEVCFPVRIGDVFDYPYKEIWPNLTEMIDKIGSERLHYGTDMPFQNRFCTYTQSRRWIEHHYRTATGISDSDISMLMGGTTASLLNIKDPKD